MTEINSEEIYFRKRLWPKLKEYSICNDIDKGRNEWTPLFDENIPPILSTPHDFEKCIPILETKYKLIQQNEVGKCFCGQNIQDHCLVINTNTNFVCWIGNDCINRFKTKHLNPIVATKNKEIIKYINNIADAVQVNEKLNLLNIEPNEETKTINEYKTKHFHQEVDENDLKELYKVCKIPSDKQINSLKAFPVYNDTIGSIEKLKIDYNKRIVTKRDGKNYIRVDTVEELKKLIQFNLNLYSKYKSYVESINIHTLIYNQDNDELKDDYLNSIKPLDPNKKYQKDLNTLSWNQVGETRTCTYCKNIFYVTIPLQQEFYECKTCFIKEFIKTNVIESVKVKVKDTEPISKSYGFVKFHDQNWILKEPICIPLRCTHEGCKFYGEIKCNIETLREVKSFNCWKCSYDTFVYKNGYHKMIDKTKQKLKPTNKVLHKDLSYEFSHQATLFYKCVNCSLYSQYSQGN